ncbi:MAG: addiction module toxin RelE [Rhodoplanes sp.]
MPRFIRDAAAAGVTEDERRRIVELVAADPLLGDEIRGSGGVRKLRIAGRGKGKSGGYRVVTAYFGPDAPVCLVALLSKVNAPISPRRKSPRLSNGRRRSRNRGAEGEDEQSN